MRFIMLPLLLIFLSLPVQAQDYQTILDIPPGQTLVNLSASEQVEVEQDLLVATLRIELQNDDPKALQDEINKTMKQALSLVKASPQIRASTQQYYVYPHDYDPTPRPIDGSNKQRQLKRTWRGSQGIELKSSQADELLELAGKLQVIGLTMSGLSYTLSPELQERTQDSLMESALAKLTAKAERAAKALGKTEAALLEVNIDMGGGYSPQPMMRSMAMGEMAQMDMPVAAPGQSTITLTVSARAILK